MLEQFHLDKAKPDAIPLANHFKLSSKHCPTSDNNKEEMWKVAYASAVGSFMYAMVCTRPNITHMQLVLLLESLLIRERNIGILSSGSYDISEELSK